MCRDAVATADAVGGAVLDVIEPVAMSADALDNVMARLDAAGPVSELPRPAKPSRDAVFPEPLRRIIGGDVDSIRWRTIGAGVKQKRLDIGGNGVSARLLWIAGGTGVLEHGHQGEELTLVLAGGFKDGAEAFVRGDVEFADGSIKHSPVADPGEPCICLAVTSAPLKFDGLLGRLAQRIVDI